MKKILRKIRRGAMIFVGVEFAFLLTLALFYGFDWYNFRFFFGLEYIIALIAVWGFLDILFVVIAVAAIGRTRQQTDLRAADIIGTDIQEAYNFGMIGMAVVTDEQIVLWTNELFEDRQIKIIDRPILEWQPAIKELHLDPPAASVKIEINTRDYEVKYLKEAHLYLFKDITAYEKLYKYSKEQAPVVGIILLDNYSDTSVNIDENNDIILSIRNTIFDYAKEYGILLRRYRADAYFALCNSISLSRMKADNFSLLDRVRKLSKDTEMYITLSIGFAYDFPDDVVKLNEMANNAIDIAVSRGGDQVVVNQYGEELAFYGGRTQVQERRNKVKVRSLADALIGLIKNSSNVLIMSHADMDLDALGSSLGVKAIVDAVGKPVKLIYVPKIVEKKTRMAVTMMFSREELDKMVVSPKEALDLLKADTLVVVTDVHRPSITMFPKLLEEATKVVVIDHHRRAEEFIENPVYSYVEPSASSASELIAELIRYASPNPRITLPSAYATIMLAGIFLDTNYYRSKTAGMRTFEASMFLKQSGADNGLADTFLKDDYEEHNLITKIMANSKTPHYGIVVALADPSDTIDRATLAKVANMNIQIKGVNATFVIGKTDPKEVRISARSDNSINVQFLLEKLGGGGHFSSAACAFNNLSIEEAEKKLLEVLETYLPAARTDGKPDGGDAS
jgi:c-di-AMP phosphodiesterase-like protein